MLAARDKPARLDGQVGDDAGATVSSADSTIMAFSPVNGFQTTSPTRTGKTPRSRPPSCVAPPWRA
jgi:hypothetical protein